MRRVLLKISGEAFASVGENIAISTLVRIAEAIVAAQVEGTQIAIVVGGGNFLRGASAQNEVLNRVTADQMGMLATIMNALVLRDAIEFCGGTCAVLSALPVLGVADAYQYRKAITHLTKGRIVVLAGGTGNPFVTTDSAASLRAIELHADVLLKATKVEGIYDRDPRHHSEAKLYRRLSYQEALTRELGVMDLSAFCQCRDYAMPIQVFNLFKAGALLKVLLGAEEEGTVVSTEGERQ